MRCYTEVGRLEHKLAGDTVVYTLAYRRERIWVLAETVVEDLVER